jgi:hypothetical protein
MAPEHEEFSHGADCVRYIAQAVEIMRNEFEPKYVEAPDPDWRL